MTDFRTLYEAKRSSAEEIAAQVENGWLLGMDAGAAQTPTLISAIAGRARRGELEGVKVQTLLDVYPLEFLADDSLFGRLTSEAWFSGGGSRRAVNAGYGDIIPNYYRDVPVLSAAATAMTPSWFRSRPWTSTAGFPCPPSAPTARP